MSWKVQLAGETLVPLLDLFEPASDEPDLAYALIKPPALTGFFYCFNGLTDPINQHSIPGTIIS